jgi:diphthine-ammonia ligase
MIDSQLHAVLVKVAALGLEPHRHLGRSLAQLQPHLRRIAAQFGGNICGEGGEYESLTLDCPMFTKGRLVLRDWEVVMHSPDAVAPVGILHPKLFVVEPKGQGVGQGPEIIQVPDHVEQEQLGQQQSSGGEAAQAQPEPSCSVSCWEGSHYLHVCCSAGASSSGSAQGPEAPEATAAAVRAALRAVEAQLQARRLGWGCSLFVHLYLRDMGHFGAANAAYCSVLPQHNPPSRACVQLPLGSGCAVLLDVLLAKPGAGEAATAAVGSLQLAEGASGQHQEGGAAAAVVPQGRRVLHVQSISDWAPSCIGPYSQATAWRGLLHMAGQIPLDPGSMAVVPGEQKRLPLGPPVICLVRLPPLPLAWQGGQQG